MANIKQYDAGNLELRPSETGVEATAGAARRIGAFYNQAAASKEEAASIRSDLGSRIGGAIRDAGDAYVQFEDHREISAGSKNFAQGQDALTSKWNDMVKGADANDPSLQAKFMEKEFEPWAENFRGSFSTDRSQQWAENHIDALREHMFQKTSADMSSLAGEAVKNNIQKAATSMTNTAFNDPSSVPFLLESTDHSVAGMISSSPNLKGVDAAKARESISQETKAAIVKSGFQGAIKTAADPEAEAQKWIKKYPEYIDGNEANQFAKAATAQKKANLLTDKQLELYGRQQLERRAEAESSKIIADNFKADADGKITINPAAVQQSIELARKYGDAGSGMARTMLGFIEAQQNKEGKAADNPGVVRDLSDRLFDPNQPLTVMDLMRARTRGEISDHTYTQLNGMLKEMDETPLKGPIYQATMAAAKEKLILNVPGIPGRDDVGIQNYSKFVQSFIPQYMAKVRAGTLEPNALDTKDPDSMISKAMEPFRRSPQQRMQDYISVMKGLGGEGPNAQTEPANVPTVTTKEQFYALPPGAVYIGKDGQRYRKP